MLLESYSTSLPYFLYGHITNYVALSVTIYVAHFIFFLPLPKNKKLITTVYWVLFIIFPVLSYKNPSFPDADLYVLLIILYMTYCYKNLVKGILLVISAFGIACAMFSFSFFAEVVLIKGVLYFTLRILVEVLIPLIIMFIIHFAKDWRTNYLNEAKHRSLSVGENIILYFAGAIQFATMFCSVGYVFVPNVFTDTVILTFLYILTFVYAITIIAFLLQSNKRAYYNSIAVLNQHYLDSEVAHFNAYKKSQVETRRIKHDMKNHLYSLNHLLNCQDIEGAKQYINSIISTVESNDFEISTNNSMADAICNEKFRLALAKDVQLSVEGLFPDEMKIDNVDLCTILANALDNAIEATSNLTSGHKWIKLQIKSQGNMLFLSFTNPTDKGVNVKVGKTTKNDSVNHGFGLQNIKYSLKKYKGKLDIELTNDNGVNLFTLNSMLIYNK